MPWAVSSSRIWSARAKLRAFFAAARSVISRSTSESSRNPLFRDGRSTSKMASKRRQKLERFGGVGGVKLSPIHGAVGVANVLRKPAARASAVLRSSFRLSPNARAASAVRSATRSFEPSGYWSVSSRSLKLPQPGPMAVAADFSRRK